MTMMPIGVSGLAGSGKDLFCNLLAKRLSVKRFALADDLKSEVSYWCYDKYDIDPLDCTREEKEKLRDFLVFHGCFMRKKTEGRYWINKLSPLIEEHLLKEKSIPVITDIRFQEYEKDEASWIKNEMNGVLVHISLYEEDKDTGEITWKNPPNLQEKIQDPILNNLADFKIVWKKIKTDNLETNSYLNYKVNEFVHWYNEKSQRTSP